MTSLATARATFSIEREYPATVEDAWQLWTTQSGIESWWGPEGFDVQVKSLDLRPGGKLIYLMSAVGPEQKMFMEQAGMPVTTECTVTYVDVVPNSRLEYTTLTDFIPGVDPYEAATVIQFEPADAGVRLVVTCDTMHDDVWTERARAGEESQLRKLDALMAAR